MIPTTAHAAEAGRDHIMLMDDLILAARAATTEFERRAAEGAGRHAAMEIAVPREPSPGFARRLWDAIFPPPPATRELYADIPIAPPARPNAGVRPR